MEVAGRFFVFGEGICALKWFYKRNCPLCSWVVSLGKLWYTGQTVGFPSEPRLLNGKGVFCEYFRDSLQRISSVAGTM